MSRTIGQRPLVLEHCQNSTRDSFWSLKRKLSTNELIHHKNGIKSDNRIDNLQIVMRKLHKGEVKCPYCLKDFAIK